MSTFCSRFSGTVAQSSIFTQSGFAVPSVDVVYSLPTPNITYVQALPTNAASTSEKAAVRLNQVTVLGSGDAANPNIVIPCVLPGIVCTYQSTKLRSTSALLNLNISIAKLPIPVSFSFPSFDIVIKCCTFSPLVMISARKLAFSSTVDHVILEIRVTPLNLPLLQSVSVCRVVPGRA